MIIDEIPSGPNPSIIFKSKNFHKNKPNFFDGLTNKTSGTVEICGIDIDVDPKTARGTIGVVPQEIIIDPFFSPLEIMNIQAGLYGIKKKEMKNLIF